MIYLVGVTHNLQFANKATDMHVSKVFETTSEMLANTALHYRERAFSD
jgi:hypothetical protein